MEKPTVLKENGYKGVKVSSILGALSHSKIKKHLRLQQANNVSKIKNKFQRTNSISTAEMSHIWTLYWNFVLNDFRFKDKEPKKVKMLNSTNLVNGYIETIKEFKVITYENR